MKKFSLLLMLMLLVLGGCASQKEIDPRACSDPEYLHLLSIPYDSMTPRQFAYFEMKDKECMQAEAVANAVHQNWVSYAENVALGFGVVVAGIFVSFLLHILS